MRRKPLLIVLAIVTFGAVAFHVLRPAPDVDVVCGDPVHGARFSWRTSSVEFRDGLIVTADGSYRQTAGELCTVAPAPPPVVQGTPMAAGRPI